MAILQFRQETDSQFLHFLPTPTLQQIYPDFLLLLLYLKKFIPSLLSFAERLSLITENDIQSFSILCMNVTVCVILTLVKS